MKRLIAWRTSTVAAAALAAIGLATAAACSSFGEGDAPTADSGPAETDAADALAPGLDAAAGDGTTQADAAPPPMGAPGCPPPGDAGAGCTMPDSIVWNGRCYFLIHDLGSRAAAAGACAAQQASLATFTCFEEWKNAAGIGTTNAWLGAQWDGAHWQWSSNEPFMFTPPGGPFDASAPVGSATCLWRDQRGDWIPSMCSSTSAGAYCERGPTQ